MGLLDRLTRRKAETLGVKEVYRLLYEQQQRLGGSQITAVHACVNVLAESMGSFPLKVYRRQPDGSRAVSSKFSGLFAQPCPGWTYFDWIEHIMWCLCLKGRYFAIMVRGTGQEIRRLLPVDDPDKVSINSKDDWTETYTFEGREYTDRDMLVIKSHSGRSVIRDQADAFEYAKALQDYSFGLFKNGARPSGVIEAPNGFKDQEAFDRFKESWQSTYGGPGGSGKVAILDNGKVFKPISVSSEDLQFLESKKYSDSQIAGIFRVPPHMIGNLEHATFSNIENLALQFSTFTMLPWCRRIEEALNKSVIRPMDPWEYCEFSQDGILRGDAASRWQAYQMARQAGVMSANDIARKENMNPIPADKGGDDYWRPANLVVAGADTQEARQ